MIKRVTVTWTEPQDCALDSIELRRVQASGYLVRQDDEMVVLRPDGRLAKRDVYAIPACCVIEVEVLQ